MQFPWLSPLSHLSNVWSSSREMTILPPSATLCSVLAHNEDTVSSGETERTLLACHVISLDVLGGLSLLASVNTK